MLSFRTELAQLAGVLPTQKQRRQPGKIDVNPKPQPGRALILMANHPLLNSGYPESAIGETDFWAFLLRPTQVTAGCLILACKEDVTSLGGVSAEAGAELPAVSIRLKQALSRTYQPEKFNYLTLIMVDSHVHFHVIPRYSKPTTVAGAVVEDAGWPRQPGMGTEANLSDEQVTEMLQSIKANWPK